MGGDTLPISISILWIKYLGDKLFGKCVNNVKKLGEGYDKPQ